MKKITIIAFVASLGLLSSCFEDEGNYDYKAPLSINVENVAASYTVIPGVDRLQISPKISPEDREYDCFWTVTAADATWGSNVDTLSHSRVWIIL